MQRFIALLLNGILKNTDPNMTKLINGSMTDQSKKRGVFNSYKKIFSTETVTVGLEYPIPFPILLSGKKNTLVLPPL
jgi:hypothetical protein